MMLVEIIVVIVIVGKSSTRSSSKSRNCSKRNVKVVYDANFKSSTNSSSRKINIRQ